VTAQTIAWRDPRATRTLRQGIEDRIATFETDPRTTANIERLLDDRLGRYPAIVVDRRWPGRVVG
jgi:hypothetical protein